MQEKVEAIEVSEEEQKEEEKVEALNKRKSSLRNNITMPSMDFVKPQARGMLKLTYTLPSSGSQEVSTSLQSIRKQMRIKTSCSFVCMWMI